MTAQSRKSFVPRVTQLDAVTLDKEINNVLKTQLVNIFQVAHSDLLAKWEPEIDAFLGFLIWKLSVLKSQATFGQQLLGIKYGGNSKYKLHMLAVLLIGGKYAADRSRTILSSLENESISTVVSKTLHWCRVAIQALSLINTAQFLGEGRFPTLVDRVLHLQPVPAVGNLSRSVGYTYMTRELLWHGFIELLVFVLPLVNYQALNNQARSLFGLRRRNVQASLMIPRLDHQTTCAVCSQPPILPHHIGCGHIFCAYCINANRLADPKFECPLCGVQALENARQVQV